MVSAEGCVITKGCLVLGERATDSPPNGKYMSEKYLKKKKSILKYLKKWRKEYPEKAHAIYKKRYERLVRANPKFCLDCGIILINRHKARCPKCLPIFKKNYQAKYFQANKKRISEYRRYWYRKKVGNIKVDFEGGDEA